MAITRVAIHSDQDVVHVRQRARLIAEQLGFGRQDQTRLSTAVSEIARNAHQYGGGGEAEFLVEGAAPAQALVVTVRDRGPGIEDLQTILEGRYKSPSGMGLGIVGTRRLMDHLVIESTPGQGTTVSLGKQLPPDSPAVTRGVVRGMAAARAAARAASPLEEARCRNTGLLDALDQLHRREEALARVNRELVEANTAMASLNSELQNHVQALSTAETALRARNEDLQAFAYTVSHDLKAPLRGIAGYARELDTKHRAGLSDRAQFCIDQIMTATRNLDQLIEDLLRYSRLEAETPLVSGVDLRRLVDVILQDRNLVIAELGVEVTVDLPFAVMRTWERALSQVLTNLIDNAIKYSRKASPPRLRIAAEAHDAGWRLSVADNGVGFDMKYHDRIFGLFNRLVRADEFEGTGAGLAIAKKLIDRQGGRIWAESAPGQGATFFVEMPKHEVSE